MRKRIEYVMGAMCAVLVGGIVGCAADEPVQPDERSEAPQIITYVATPDVVAVGEEVDFSWELGEQEDTAWLCELDITADGEVDAEIEDCGVETSWTYSYEEAGSFETRLVVVDEHGQSDEATTSVEVWAEEPPEISGDLGFSERIIRNFVAEPVDVSRDFVVETPESTPFAEFEISAESSESDVSGEDLVVDCDAVGECLVSARVSRREERVIEVTVTATGPTGASVSEVLDISVEPRVAYNADPTGTNSLREAIGDSDDGDYIAFELNGPETIYLFGAIELDRDLIIEGPGVDDLTIDGQENGRIFEVAEGLTVEIWDMTLRRGVSPEDENGGAVYNEGALTLRDVVIEDSEADGESGGAIHNAAAGVLFLERCVLSNNTASFGGAIYTRGDVFVDEVYFVDNTATVTGGAVYHAGGFQVKSSTFESNFASNHGGGILNDDSEEKTPMRIINTTFVDNTTEVSGGAIFNLGRTELSFVTMTGNEIVGEDQPFSTQGGAGIRNSGSGSLQLHATTIADNIYDAEPDLMSSGEITTRGYNFIGTDEGYTIIDEESTDVTGGDAQFGVLGDHGGFAPTVMLEASSPLIDQVSAEDCIDMQANDVETDQRGMQRPGGSGHCDIGAVEMQ